MNNTTVNWRREATLGVLSQRGASHAGYDDLGCAKIFRLMGQFFAEVTLGMMKK